MATSKISLAFSLPRLPSRPAMAMPKQKSLHPFSLLAIAIAILLSCPSLSHSLPFVVLHGLGNECAKEGLTWFTELLSNHTGEEGFCIEVGSGIKSSWLTSVTKQVDEVCETIKSMPELKSGFNLVALSQGTVIGRGVIQWCEGAPPVNNMVSIGGPQAGVASVPYCGSSFFCKVADWMIELGVYTSYVQNHLGPAGYVKIPTDLTAYYKKCKFLPRLNNELEDSRNTTYTERFTSLNQLVLIMFEEDNVLKPRETAWFGYFPAGSTDTILSYNETDLYIEDWFGLKTLDEAGNVTWFSLPRGHLHINETEMITYIVPYLGNSSVVQSYEDGRIAYLSTREGEPELAFEL